MQPLIRISYLPFARRRKLYVGNLTAFAIITIIMYYFAEANNRKKR